MAEDHSGVRPSNLVVIMTDNQSPWSLGCYGNAEIRTPCIDRLAAGGVRFDRAFSCNAVCSPSRASFLTGLIPSQHGVHRYLGSGGAQIGPRAFNTIAEFPSLPKTLAAAGYACGLSGKWHLGDNLHPQEGFSFWTTTTHGHTTTFYDAEVIEDGRIRTEPTYLTDYWTRRGVEFIERHQAQPFFLFLAYNGPYGLGASMLRPARNRHAAYYADHPLSSFPREEPHPWLWSTRNLLNQPAAMRRYAAEVSGVDDGVGEVMHCLERLGLEQDTLVVYTADQGLAGGQGGLWGMGDHTRPLTAFDSTMHIPLIYHHPARIPAGRRSGNMISHYDALPTLTAHLGLAAPEPSGPVSPGHSCASLLRGEEIAWEDVIFYEFENVRAIRTRQWKYIERFREEPNELYDLEHDPVERHNLMDQTESAAIRETLRARLHEFFARYADPRWDLWRGGYSKSELSTAALFARESPGDNPS
jgi:arylsulfatase A-like enzyme